MQRRTLAALSLAGLLSFTLLASALAGGHGVYSFENSLLSSLGSPSSVGTWADVADLLSAPVIVVVLLIALVFGLLRRCLVRVAVYAGLAGITFLVSEHVAKPLVHETYAGQLTFPSGTVTAVCATALAVWLALHPLLGRRARLLVFLLGTAWVLLTAVAVVGGHWHTPLDALGSVLLSLGLVAGGGALYEPGSSGGLTDGGQDLSVAASAEDRTSMSDVGRS